MKITTLCQNLIRLLLEKGADPNILSSDGLSPLYQAVKNSNIETIRILLNKGAHPDSDSSGRDTPLYQAVRNKHHAIAELLLKCNADPDCNAEGEETALYQAAKNNDLKMVMLLLNANADINANNIGGKTPLWEAASLRHRGRYYQYFRKANIIELLLNRGASAKYNGGGESVLQKLISDFYTPPDIILKAIEAGADPDRGEGKQHPLYLLIEYKHPLNLLEKIFSYQVDPNGHTTGVYTPLTYAIRNNDRDIETVKLLLDRGADPNALAEGDSTPLYRAIITESPCLEMVKLLLKYDADPDCCTEGDDTALYCAVDWYLESPEPCPNHSELISILLANKANPDCHTKGKNTPLYMAANCKNAFLVSVLLEAGADVNAKAPGGDTPLLAASQRKPSQYRNIENGNLYHIIKTLLAHNADSPYTLVHWNALIQATFIAKKPPDLLIEYIKAGIDPDSRIGYEHLLYQAVEHHYPIAYLKQLLEYPLHLDSYSDRWNPLWIAAKNGNTDALRLLLEKGADPDASTHGNDWPLIAAIKNNHLKSVKLLLQHGAKPDRFINSKWHPLTRALEDNAHDKIVAALLRYGASTTVIPLTNKEDHKRIKTLIKKHHIPTEHINPSLPLHKKRQIRLYHPYQKSRLRVAAVEKLPLATSEPVDNAASSGESGKFYSSSTLAGVSRTISETNTNPQHIAIIGGGASGLMSAIFALQASVMSRKPIQITLYERQKNGFGGLAYSHATSQSFHPLNIKPSDLSILLGNSQNFVDFLDDTRKKDKCAGIYHGQASRHEFYQYVEHHLKLAVELAHPGSTIVRLNRNVVDLAPLNDQQIQLFTKDIAAPKTATHDVKTETEGYERIIIATGNQLSTKPPAFVKRVSGRYINTLYAPAAYKKIKRFSQQINTKSKTVVIIGTGLSALDAILTLKKFGYNGKIICISRHGQTYFRYSEGVITRNKLLFFRGSNTPDFLKRVNEKTSVAEIETWIKDYLKEVLMLDDDDSFYHFMEGSLVSGKADNPEKSIFLEELLTQGSRYIAELARKLAPDTARTLLNKYSSAINSHRFGIIPEVYDPIKN